MHRAATLAASLAALLLAGPALSGGYASEPASGGAIPRRAFAAGQEANGEALFVCAVAHAGGWHPGKIRPGFGGCNFGYGGQELTGASYEVLTGSYGWVEFPGPGPIPGNAIAMGVEGDGRALYVCRAPYKGGWHPGKIRAGFNGCNIGYGGREITVGTYDVLVP